MNVSRICRPALVVGLVLGLATVPSPAAEESDAPASLVVERVETSVRIEQDGRLAAKIFSVTRIVDEQGKQSLQQLYWPFKENTGSVEIHFVRTEKPSGEIVETDPGSAQIVTPPVARENPIFTDLRFKVLPVAALDVGDRLETRITLRIDHPIVEGQFWWVQPVTTAAAVEAETVVLDLPAGRDVALTYDSESPPRTETAEGRTVHTWAFESESPAVREGEVFRVSSWRSWKEFGGWMSGLLDESAASTPELERLAAELTQDESELDAKITAIFSEVSFAVRYVSISLGLGSYVPHAARDVWRNKYGDCKDKHTLLAVLLRAHGIEAYAALVNTMGDVNEEVPSPADFNHMVTAIPRPEGWLFLDSTLGTPPGYVPIPLRNKRALILRKDRTEFVRIPEGSDVADSVEVLVTGSVDDRGSLQAGIVQTYRGWLEPMFRAVARQNDDAVWSNMYTTASWLNSTKKVAVSDPGDLTEPFRVEVASQGGVPFDSFRKSTTITLPGIAIEASSMLLMPLTPSAFVGPADFHDRFEIEIPGAAVQLPPAVDEQRECGRYSARYSFENDRLVVDRRIRIDSAVSASVFAEEWQGFYQAIEADLATKVIVDLEKAPDPIAGADAEGLIVRLRAGLEALMTGDSARAIDLFEAAARDFSEDPDVHQFLGAAYMLGERPEDALESLNRALALGPGDESLYFQIGFLQHMFGNHEAAAEALTRALQYEPDDNVTRLLLAATLVESRNWEAAERHLTRSLDREPNRPDSRILLAQAQLCQGKPEAAEANFKAALEIGNDANLYGDIAEAIVECEGNPEHAATYAEEAVARAAFEVRRIRSLGNWKVGLYSQSQLGSYLGIYGRALARKGDPESALRFLEAALQLYPTPQTAHFVADVHATSGNENEARYYLAVAHILAESQGRPVSGALQAFGSERFKNRAELTNWIDSQRGRYALSHLIDAEDGAFPNPAGEDDTSQRVVRCAALVSPSGDVLDVQLVEGESPWSEAALGGVSEMKLEPISWSDAPVPSIRIVVVTFGSGKGTQVRYALMTEVAELTEGFRAQQEADFLRGQLPF